MRAPAEVLVMCGVAARAQRLLASLQRAGAAVDLAGDLGQARERFLARGGHDWLVLLPDVPPALATEAVHDLRALDARLRVVVFGSGQLRECNAARVVRLQAYHPSSRAGIGAVLKLLVASARR
jgi:hypothetical protein